MAADRFRLTQAQEEQFDRDGYTIVEGVFSDAELQPVIDEICAEVDSQARALVKSGELSRTYEEFGFETRLAHISSETDKVARAIWNGALHGPAVFDLIRNPKLLDIATQICRSNELIASSVYRMRPKIPNYSYGAVPWHQDSGYTEPFCDRSMMLTVWLPLVDANKERGCMWVMPGVQRNGILKHEGRVGKSYLVIPDTELPAVEPICAEVKKGGVLLLTNMTPHVSFDNTSDVVRWSMDLRYQSAALPTNAAITRLPEEVAAQDEMEYPPACYPPEADFLVRSQQRPEQVVSDPTVFRAIRENHLAQPVTVRWETF